MNDSGFQMTSERSGSVAENWGGGNRSGFRLRSVSLFLLFFKSFAFPKQREYRSGPVFPRRGIAVCLLSVLLLAGPAREAEAQMDPPLINVNSTTMSPITEGQSVTWTLTADPAPAADLTVNFYIGDASSSDFVLAEDQRNQEITIGTTGSVMYTLNTVSDNIDEADGTVTLNILPGGSSYMGGDQGSYYVLVNDDDPTGVTLAGEATALIEGETRTFTLKIPRPLRAGEKLVVPITSAGKATRGVDYTLACQNPLPTTGITCASNMNAADAAVTITGSHGGSATSVTITLASADDGMAESGGETINLDIGTLAATDLSGGTDKTDSAGQFTLNDVPKKPVSLSVNRGGAATEGGSTLMITATLESANTSGSAISIPIRVRQAGTTAQSDDYTFASSISIANNQSSGTRIFTVKDDGKDEPDETVVFELHNFPAGFGQGSPDHVTITITDNDKTAVTLAGENTALIEGETRTFTLKIPRPLRAGEKLVVPIKNFGPATRGVDYTLACQNPPPTGITCANMNAANRSVTITGSAGGSATSVTITLTSVDDGTAESDEWIDLDITHKTLVDTNLDGGTRTADLAGKFDLNDPPRVNLSVSGGGAVTEGGSALTITATLGSANTSGSAISIPIRVRPAGTTAQSDDYILASSSISIANNAGSGTTTFTVRDDMEDEPDETVVVELGSLPSGVSQGSAASVTITITDNDRTAVTLTGTSTPLTEGGTRDFRLEIPRALRAGEKLVVPITSAGTATRGTDYTLACASAAGITCASNMNAADAAVTITGSAGGSATSVTITFASVDDGEDEAGGETVDLGIGTLAATNLDGGTRKTDSAGPFTLDDVPANPVNLSVSADSVTEGEAALTITATLGSPNTSGAEIGIPIIVQASGTTAQEADYEPLAPGISIASNESSGTTSFTVTDDPEDELDETVVIELGSPLPWDELGRGPMAEVPITIIDNDVPEITISGGDAVTEGSDTGFTLSASIVPAADLEVSVTVADASGGSDFVDSGDEGDKTVTVTAQTQTAPYAVFTVNDGVEEPDGSVTVTVNGGEGYTVGSASSATVTVRDDDRTQTETTQPETETTPEDEEETENPDRAALLAIYQATGGDDWEENEHWGTREPVGSWHGVDVVTVDGEERVAGLYLHDNGLSGEFPVLQLSDLPNLAELALWGNEGLAGAPDDRRADRAVLRVFYDGNGSSAIEGWFPEDEDEGDYFLYSDWEGVMADEDGRITELDFSGNSDVAGELPLGVMSLSALTYLDISGTRLCVPEDQAFKEWLGREGELSFTGNDGYVCEEEGTGEENRQGGGGGGCAVASDAKRGVFQLVLLVFALGAAVSGVSRFGVFRKG